MNNNMIRQAINMRVNNLMNQLKVRQPQMFQMLNQVSQNQGDYMGLLKQTIGNYTPQQLQNYYSIAQQMGFPNEVLIEVQNQMGINTQ